MENHYEIQPGSPEQRRRVENLLSGLEEVDAATGERVVTAWVTSWLNSPYSDLSEAPYGPLAPDYPLMDHVREVLQFGLVLASEAAEKWNQTCGADTLVPILLLHDVDKPLMYVRTENGVQPSPLASTLPHGVVGSMIVHDLGFEQKVVNTVATHSGNSPFHGVQFEDFILHYADMFTSDRAILAAGGKPYYQK